MVALSDKELLGKVVKGLKALRNEKGISQTDVVQETGINIGRVEAGLQGIKLTTLYKLCEHYGVPVSDFLKMYCGL